MSNGTINGIEYDDIYYISHHYIDNIKYIPHIPKSCIYCGDYDLIGDIVQVKVGLTKNNLKFQNSLLCVNCETLMVVGHNTKRYFMINPLFGNKVILRQSMFKPVDNSFRMFEFSSFVSDCEIFEESVELTNSALFEYVGFGRI